MPLFEYRCSECHQVSEILVRNSEQVVCIGCGSTQVEKLLSAPVAHSAQGSDLPLANACPPSSAPPCGPGCCRLPQ